MPRQHDSTVMRRCAQHLSAQRDRPFAAAQDDKKEPSHTTACILCSSAQIPSALRNPGPVSSVDVCYATASDATTSDVGAVCRDDDPYGSAHDMHDTSFLSFLLKNPSLFVILYITFLNYFNGYITCLERMNYQHWLLNITQVG
jgi:hypothetical protein